MVFSLKPASGETKAQSSPPFLQKLRVELRRTEPGRKASLSWSQIHFLTHHESWGPARGFQSHFHK